MSESNKIKYSILPTTMIVEVDGKIHTISKTDHRFEKLKNSLQNKNFDEISNLINPTKVLNQEGFEVKNGIVYYKNEPIPTILGDQFIDYKMDQISFTALVNFWLNLKNRAEFKDSKEYIVELLNKRGYPVTEDGFIIVYREDENTTNIKFNPKTKIITPFFNYSHISSHYKKFFDDKKSLNQICEEVFGFCTKKLINLLRSNMFIDGDPFVHPEILNYGITFKGLLSPNNLFSIMEKKLFPINRGDANSFKDMNTFFKEFAKTKDGSISEKKILNLLESKYRWEQLLDCGSLYNQLKAKVNIDLSDANFTTNVEVIYNYLTKEFQKLNDPEYDLHVLSNYPKIVPLLEKTIGADLKVVIPKNNYDLKEWSRKMSNCIHGYGKDVLEQRCLVLAIVDLKGKMLYNLEIRNGKIRQFRSKNNQTADKKDQEIVIQALFDSELLINTTGEN